MKSLFNIRLLIIFTALNFVLLGQGFTISDNANFNLGSAVLSLTDNFTNNGVFNPASGTIAFNGTTGNQTYSDPSGVTLNNLSVNKTSGDLLLANSITINGVLSCISGDLNLSGFIVYLGPTGLLSESAGSTVKGTTGHIEATRNLNAPNNLNVAGLGFQITSAENLGTTKIVRKHKEQPTNTNGSILRLYEVTPINNTGLNANITIYYDTDELNSLTEANLQLFRSTDNGNTWSRSGGVIDVANKRISLGSLDSFSSWTMSNNESCTISNSGGMITCTKGTYVELFSSVFITDPDDAKSAGAVIQITNNYINTEDQLTFSDKNGITGSWNQALGTLTLSGNATKDEYVDAIRSVQYGIKSSTVTENIRTFSLTVNDGSNNSNTLTKDVSVQEANGIPGLSINNGLHVSEGCAITITDINLGAVDFDGPSYSITYNVTREPQYGALSFNRAMLKTGDSFSFTQNDIANGKLVYSHDGGENPSDYFTFTLSDELGGTSEEFTFSITIDNSNDPPFTEKLSDIVMNEDETFQLGLSYWYEYIQDPDDDDSTLTFNLTCSNSSICLTAISDTLFRITTKENYFGNDSLTVIFKDPSKDSCCIKTKIIIEPINDLPAISGLPETIEVTQKETKTLRILDYLSDIETPDSLIRLSFSTDIDSIFTSYSSKTGNMSILSLSSYIGNADLTITAIDEHGGKSNTSVTLIISPAVTDVETVQGIPLDYELQHNYPNPFNPTTRIKYGIPDLSLTEITAQVQLKIFDILGREVLTLVNESQSPGYYEYTWNASDMSSGIYFYMLFVKSGTKIHKEVKKMLLIK